MIEKILARFPLKTSMKSVSIKSTVGAWVEIRALGFDVKKTAPGKADVVKVVR